jgi:hypothetical protein
MFCHSPRTSITTSWSRFSRGSMDASVPSGRAQSGAYAIVMILAGGGPEAIITADMLPQDVGSMVPAMPTSE